MGRQFGADPADASLAPTPSPRPDRAADAPAPPVPAPLPWITRVGHRALWLALAASLLTHAALLTLAAVWWIAGGGPGGSGAGPASGPVEFAIITEAELNAGADAPLDTTTPVLADADGAPAVTSPLEVPEVGSGEGGGPADAGDLGSVGTLGGAGSGESIGIGPGEGGTGGGGASFFGVEARGSRFAYVVDVSGSMEGPRIAALRLQLAQSVAGLIDNAQFMIFFFESEALPIGGRDRWLDANSKTKDWAADLVSRIAARGGTNPEPALRLSMALKPRPDAIYFMTDGIFPEQVADVVVALNRQGKRVPVHCIAFGERGSEALLRRIAEDSGGTYTFVPEPQR